jgi:hypothetical protein
MALPDNTIIRTRPRGPHTKAVRVDAATAHTITSLANDLGMRASDVIVIAVRLIFLAQTAPPPRPKSTRRSTENVFRISQIQFSTQGKRE